MRRSSCPNSGCFVRCEVELTISCYLKTKSNSNPNPHSNRNFNLICDFNLDGNHDCSHIYIISVARNVTITVKRTVTMTVIGTRTGAGTGTTTVTVTFDPKLSLCVTQSLSPSPMVAGGGGVPHARTSCLQNARAHHCRGLHCDHMVACMVVVEDATGEASYMSVSCISAFVCKGVRGACGIREHMAHTVQNVLPELIATWPTSLIRTNTGVGFTTKAVRRVRAEPPCVCGSA